MNRELFSLKDPAVIADPYPHYERLREQTPVYHLGKPDLWVLSRHADVQAVLRDPQSFSSDLRSFARSLSGNPFNPALTIPRPARFLVSLWPLVRVLLTSDPPEHTILRRKISKAFTPKMIGGLGPRIRQISERLLDPPGTADVSGPVDLVKQLASPLTTTVIAELMVIPAERRDDFKRWSDDLVGGLVGRGSIARMLASAVEISFFFKRVVRQRRKNPGDDLISLLVSGDNDTALTPRELTTFCILLLAAGNETTTNLIASAPKRINSPVLRGLHSLPVTYRSRASTWLKPVAARDQTEPSA